MTAFAVTAESTMHQVAAALGTKVAQVTVALGEVSVTVAPADYMDAAIALRDDAGCRFEQLLDLCGVDYSQYGDGSWTGARYCVVSHLLSVSLNQRVRLKVFAPDDDLPLLNSVTAVWRSAQWFEREAFDLFGIVFDGHDDLRRILTDYGFIGYPFRKDFPTIGHVEMIYDEAQQRVVYQPVSIEAREIVPRVIREERYAGMR